MNLIAGYPQPSLPFLDGGAILGPAPKHRGERGGMLAGTVTALTPVFLIIAYGPACALPRAGQPSPTAAAPSPSPCLIDLLAIVIAATTVRRA